MIIVGSALKQARESAGITASELAKEANVSRPTLVGAEKGTPIRYPYASRIVNALNRLAGTDYTVEELEIATV